ncbi:MAG: iron ABC transporter permease [Actinobacteria bacterium]|nr:iron ABC transporter permease [Actinomycetota bacterium]MBU1494604.1 iron ABC transporter permease [Actinomycetota bacterium]
MSRPRPGRWALAALPLSFLGVFFLWPLVSIVWTGLAPGGVFDPSAFGKVLGNGSLLDVVWFTLWQATLSTALTLVVALPGAYVFARYDFPGKRLLRAAATIPFVLPTMVAGTAFLALIGPNGALGVRLDGTVTAILLAHVFFNYAVVLRTVGGLWSHLDPRLEEAARALGASRWRTFTSVTLPLLRPAIAAAASIVFLFTFTSFGIVLILGGAGLATLEVEIYRQTSTLFDLPVAAVLAILQLVGVTAVLLAYSRYQERNAVEQSLRPAAETSRRPRGARERVMVGGVLSSMALLLGAPPTVLVQRSLSTGDGWGLGFYRALGEQGRTAAQFVDAGEAVRNSLGFAVAATVIALVIGLTAAAVVSAGRGRSSRWFDSLLMLPLGTSAVTIGFGFIVALDAPVDLRASAWLIPLAHSLVAIPFVVRSVVPVMRSVRARLREAAAVLGASPRRVWREIDLPIVSRAAAVGAGFAMAVSLGEFGATAFVARPDTPTMPVAIFRYLGRPGEINFGRAMAMSVILMVVTAAAVALIERFRAPGLGEF